MIFKRKKNNRDKDQGDKITIGDVGDGAAVAAGRNAQAKVSIHESFQNLESEFEKIEKNFKIFLSSTWKDLQPEREAVEKALHRMKGTVFVGMEYFGSRPDTPREASLEEVDSCNIYVGIFGHRYGSGITEDEYRRAVEKKLPCLVYLKDRSVPVLPDQMERDSKQMSKLLNLKNELEEKYIVSYFKSPEELAVQIAADLHNHIIKD